MKNSNINPYIALLLKGPDARRLGMEGIGSFANINIDSVSKTLLKKPALFWEQNGEQMALELFRKAAQRVPAYAQFLAKHRINPANIKTIKDFKKLPHTDKNTYIKAYPLESLCWDGKLYDNTLFSVSSGSSGVPFFWPRGDNLETETGLIHALLMKIFEAHRTPTLVVVSFSMGIYIAGVITSTSVLRASENGLPVTLITPGVEINDVLRAIKELGGKYGQIILAGYPPFIKDIIDSGQKQGIEWEKLNIKFLFATENFSETFREYVFGKTKEKNVINFSLNIYGSADAGVLGHETPLSIGLRRLASKNRQFASLLWGENAFAPTFVQYYPIFKYFEEENGELLFSAYGGIPLIRYNVHDAGRIIPFEKALGLTQAKQAISSAGEEVWKLPFLCVFGKSDFTISFYGLKIYPENIREGLEHEEAVPFVTGRFTMEQKMKKNQDQYWEINIELREDFKDAPLMRRIITERIVKVLRKRNLEFNRLHEAIGKRANPKINLWQKGAKRYFNPRAIKQRWTVR